MAARRWLRANAQRPVALFVPSATRTEFEGLPVADVSAATEVGAVVLGDLGEGWSFATLNRAFRLLMEANRPPIVALGMTRYWRAPGGLQLDVGPFVVALEHASGCRVEVMGKPAAAFFGAALEMIEESPEDTVMIGDDIVGDIEAAQAMGIRGLLVKTGKFRAADLERGIVPQGVLSTVAELPAWWEAHAAELG